jgi:hypothetical protein
MAGMDATIAVLTALRTTLKADSSLVALGITEVYDRPSPEQAGPYLTMGAVRYDDWSWADSDGQEFRIDFTAWDHAPGQVIDTLRCRQVMDRVRVVLHYASLTLTSPYRSVLVQAINSIGPLQDPDGAQIYGVVTIRALVDHT